jgi:iron complex outermembrane receptor protein
MDLVDRVEVIRGPGSALYGNNAFFTIINVVTRRGQDVQGTEVSGSASGYSTETGRITYGNKFTNGVEMVVSGSYLASAGHHRLHYSEFNATNNGDAVNMDTDESKSLFTTISYKDFTFEGGYVDRRKLNPAAPYGIVFNDPRYLNIDERSFTELRFHHEFEGSWDLQARVYYDRYAFDADYPYNYNAPAPGPITINRDWARWQGAGSEVIATAGLGSRNNVTVGAEFREDFQLDLLNYDVNPPSSYVNSRRDQYSVGLYSQDELKILTNLTATAGLRFDYFSTFGDALNPRAGLIYNPWTGSAFKALYGRAYRAPNANELYYVQPTYKANPSLQPEKIQSYELVYEQAFLQSYRFSASVFYNDISGLISQRTDPNDGKIFYDNIDNVDARGVEFELGGKWKHGLRGVISYAYAEARNSATDTILNNSPRHIGKANVAIPLWPDKVFAGLEFQAMSSRTTHLGTEVGSFWIANATLYSRQIIKNLEFSASVYNLFDRHYSDPVSDDFVQAAIRQDGRSFRVKLTYRF